MYKNESEGTGRDGDASRDVQLEGQGQKVRGTASDGDGKFYLGPKGPGRKLQIRSRDEDPNSKRDASRLYSDHGHDHNEELFGKTVFCDFLIFPQKISVFGSSQVGQAVLA